MTSDSRLNVYLYLDGSDNAHLETNALVRLRAIAEKYSNFVNKLVVVNDRPSDFHPNSMGDLPDWDLGLCVSYPGSCPADLVLKDLNLIVEALRPLAKEFNRHFAIGGHVNGQCSEDWTYVGGDSKHVVLQPFLPRPA